MKKIILAVCIVIILIISVINRQMISSSIENIVYQSPCAVPRTYSIGSIDPRFKISKATFLAVTEQAASLWRNADGKSLFVYDPDAKLTINLVYDERQYLNNQVNDLNDQVETQKNTLKPEIADYERRAA